MGTLDRIREIFGVVPRATYEELIDEADSQGYLTPDETNEWLADRGL